MKMPKFSFLIILSASLLFSHVLGIRKFPDLNNPRIVFKEQSVVRSKAVDDQNCDKQLQMFSDGFSNREAWTIRCKDFDS